MTIRTKSHIVTIVSFLGATGIALADVKAADPPKPTGETTRLHAGVTDDVVVTKDGGKFRGIIIESTPDHVKILLPTSEVKEFKRDQVTYEGAFPPPSGSASANGTGQLPVDASKAQNVDSKKVTIQFSPNRNDTTVYGRLWTTDGLVGDKLCLAPCSAQLAPGKYRFGLSKDGDAVIDANEPITLESDAEIIAKYDSVKGAKIGLIVAGSVIMAGAVTALGITGTYGSIPDCRMVGSGRNVREECEDPDNTVTYVVEGVIGVIGAGILIGGLTRFDSVSFTKKPNTSILSRISVSPLQSRLRSDRTPAPFIPQGLSIQLTY